MSYFKQSLTCRGERRSLSREIVAVLIVKFTLLALLGYGLFRIDPGIHRPSVADAIIGSPSGPISSNPNQQ